MLLESDKGEISIQKLIADRIFYMRAGKGKIPVLTPDLDSIEDTFSIVQAMRRFLSGESLTCDSPDGRTTISSLGKIVCTFLDYDYCGLCKSLDGSRMHPYLQIMGKIIDAHRRQVFFNWPMGKEAEGLKSLEEYVRAEIDSEGGADVPRKAARYIARGVRKNIASLESFISGMALNGRQLKAVSVDLRYIHDVFYENGDGHRAELVKRDLDSIIRIVAGKFPSSILGYFWKLDFGLGRKFYARAVFFIEVSVSTDFFDFLKKKAVGDELKISENCFLSSYEFAGGEESLDTFNESSTEYWEKVKGNAALLLAADELIRVDYSNRRVYGRSGLLVE